MQDSSSIVVMADASYVEFLKKRVADLEDAMSELVPLGDAFEINMATFFRARSQEESDAKRSSFMRDTLHMDQHVFRRIKKLMENRVS